MKSVWNGKNKKILFLVIFIGMILLPGCYDSPTRPGEGFYSYRGYRDWWRIPLDYPYQIYIANSLPEMMKLEKFYNLMWQAIEKNKTTRHTKTCLLTSWRPGNFLPFFQN